MFEGDPMSPANRALIEKTQIARFRGGSRWGTGPEVNDEEVVRAMMVVRANAMIYNAPSPQLSQMLLDLLNRRVTPVVQSRGTLGEGDLAQLGNVGAAMVDVGDAYYRGVRMPADQALKRSGLAPIQPFAADDNALTSTSIRQASAWEAWAVLRDAVVLQANSSDHNPAISVSLGPTDSWELATPQMMRFYVKGGVLSHGQHGYIVSNANWDPYPLANKLEDFVIALANMDVAVMLRIERFRNTFFTGVAAESVIPGARADFYGYAPVDLQQEVAGLMNPVAPFGSAIVGTVEDLQAQTRIKVQHARQAVDTTFDLLGFDLLEGSMWIDVRKIQDARRQFGPVPTAAWAAYRKAVPLGSVAAATADFLRNMPAAMFFRDLPPAAANAP
jgi:histidine ammonia-lyase